MALNDTVYVEPIVIPTAHFKGRWRHLKTVTLFREAEMVRVQAGDNPEHSRYFDNTNPEPDYMNGDPAVIAWLNEMAEYLGRGNRERC